MESDKPHASEFALDLPSFQLLRAGRPVRLEKNPMELLSLLVSRRGALVSREEIVHQLWGDSVHVDVESGINTAIRKIRQALEDDPAQPRYLETVVVKGYRFVGAITVIEGTKKLETATNPPALESRRPFWMALFAAGLAVIFLAFMWLSHRNTAAASGDRQGRIIVGVVPLRNLSETPGQDYFVEGLTEEILAQLGQLNPERLGVVKCAREGGTRAGSGVPSGLKYRVEGSVRRDHERTRISVRLVRQWDETTAWVDSIDRAGGDALSLQSEIAQRIGRELQIQALARRRAKPASPEVVEAYLRGRFELNRGEELPDAARVYFERAIALDPSYAPAYAGLADFHRSWAIRRDAGSELAWRLAGQYAEQALSLDGESAETHVALAQIKLMHEWDWKSAREHALRALQLNPSSPDAHSVYARYLRTAGKVAEALSQREQALALDPFRADLREQLGLERYFARDYQTTVAQARGIVGKDPSNLSAHVDLCFGLGRLKLFQQAVAECSTELTLEGHEDWARAYVQQYRKHGYEAASTWMARKQLSDLLRQPQPDLWELANAYVSAGMQNEALDTLFRGLPVHEPGLLQVRVDPDFDPLRGDPRYAELVRGIGFPSE
jgi:DNA-binding winged helix-turn-helix (wHTH) protein/TolB-like protein